MPTIPQHLLYDTIEDVQSRIDFKNQAQELPGTRRKGQTGHYVSTVWPNKEVLLASPKPQTTAELFDQAVDECPDAEFLGRIPLLSPEGAPKVWGEKIIYETYGQIGKRRDELAAGMMHMYRAGKLGSPEKIDKDAGEGGWGVGIWSSNRPEWQIVDLACQSTSLVSIALYDTLGPNASEYIINHANLSIIFTSGDHLAQTLTLLPKCPSLKAVVSLDALGSSLGGKGDLARSWGQGKNIWVGDIHEFEQLGRENPSKPLVPKPSNIVTISYTSGTSGTPKGVLLTHRQFTTAVIAQVQGNSSAGKGLITASYLPLSHIYERFVELASAYFRGRIVYTTGDPLRLLIDMQLIKPHAFISVPRVLNRIYAAIMAQANAGGVKGALIQRAINTKIANWRRTGTVKHAIYDRLVFSKIQALLGGNVIYMTSGSAPLGSAVFELMKVCFACDVIEGWGMTETVGTGTRGWPNDVGATGTIGPPHPCNEIKLVDVPEMGYSAEDKPFARGELCIRGLNTFVGYYKDEKNTKETIDEEGWVHTGDVAAVDAAGRFKIIDRKKNIMKLSQGEYVALESVEGVYALSPLFASLMIYGDSLRSHLIALGQVDPISFPVFAEKVLGRPVGAHELEEVVKDEKIQKAVVGHLQTIGKSKKLNGYEMVKGIHIMATPFPEDCLTPTFKFKRPVVKKMFSDVIDKIYERTETTTAFASKL